MNWGGILSTLGDVAGKAIGSQIGPSIPGMGSADGRSVGGALGSELGKGVGGLLGPSTGKTAGRNAKDYFDEFAPGTSKWDRLGASNPSGSIAGPQESGKVAKDIQKANIEKDYTLQDKAIKKDLKVAEIQADTARAVAGASHGGTITPKENTQTRIAAEVERIREDIKLVKQRASTEREETAKRSAERRLREAEAKRADLLAVNKETSGSPWLYREYRKVLEQASKYIADHKHEWNDPPSNVFSRAKVRKKGLGSAASAPKVEAIDRRKRPGRERQPHRLDRLRRRKAY